MKIVADEAVLNKANYDHIFGNARVVHCCALQLLRLPPCRKAKIKARKWQIDDLLVCLRICLCLT